MQQLMAGFSFLAADPVTETKMPCKVVDFDYRTRIDLATFTPLVIAGLVLLGSMAWAAQHRKDKGGNLLHASLWHAAPFALQFLDFVYPAVTRTLLQYFTCRPLGAAGSWLEADYGVQCTEARWDPEAGSKGS